MAVKFTDAQNNAINSTGCVLVSAAAGSGKTAVLVERVVKMLTDRQSGVSADRMLIVTFTNAAAAEMLSRIENRLYKELQSSSGDDYEHINRQCYLIKSADICTIDSFCIRLVRENFALCSIEPDFKVTDDSSLYSVRREVLSEIISEHINDGEKFRLLTHLSNCRYGEEPLMDLMDGIYISAKKSTDVGVFINSLKVPYNTPFDREHIWYKYAFSYADERLSQIDNKVRHLAEAALFCENTDKAVLYSESVSNIIHDVRIAVNSGEWDSVFEVVRSAKLGSLPAKSTDEMKLYKEQIVRDIESIKSLFGNPALGVADDIKKLSGPVELLSDMVTEYNERLFERLKEENKFSFDDIEQLALKLICSVDENKVIHKTEFADSIISRYDRVLVDEFQDVNELQDTLFEVLSGGGKNLFIVGDVKQSIYAFRGSDPDIFLAKKTAYKDYSETNPEDKRKILLLDNFRSRKGICSAVNFFFENLMSEQVGSLVYDEGERLNCGAEFPENNQIATDLLVIDKVDDDSSDSVIQSEAIAIADYIERTVKKGEILRGEGDSLRSVKYGDFCILLAALKDKSGVIADELNRRLIPAKVSDGEFSSSTEIVTLSALLHIIDNPQSDVDLLRVLMSPLYSFSAEELAEIRVGRKDMSLFAALSLFAAENEKAQEFLNQLSEFRRMSCMLPLDRFISYLIDKTDMMNIFYAMPDGEIRSQNLMQFMKLASDYASGNSGSIYGFLRYMSRLPEDAVKPAASQSENCVKIMSIHRSKGLQFPICIVAGLSNKINKSDAVDACIYSKENGIGFKYFDRDALEKNENLGHKVLSAESKKSIARERLRLLYVGMTRAEEKLCLVCSMKNAQKSLMRAALASNHGREKISGDFIINAANSAEYVLAAALIHPDSDALRRTAECSVSTVSTESSMAVRFIDAAKLKTENTTDKLSAAADVDLTKSILSNIEYSYPYAALSKIPSKVSVSKLANTEEYEHFAMTDRPAFMEKDGLNAAGRGTAIHKIMQFIDYKNENSIDSEIERLVSEKRISSSEAAVADRKRLSRFFESELFYRIKKADTVKREMRFLTELPVSVYDKEKTGAEDKFIVQGAVDLCFLEDDGVVVVDFKTDYTQSEEELKQKYSAQLSIYAAACEKIFSMPVKEKIIYSFHLSKEIRV